jgi:CheY-like chemotaxis protein
VPAHVRGDPARFRQILLNLVGNAAKFTQSGEIELSLDAGEMEDGDIRLYARVRDTGIGVQKEKLEAIFEPFQQADTSTTRQYGGTGLGLAISRRLAKLMNGDIRAESEPGRGSTFFFEAAFAKSPTKKDLGLYQASLASRKTLIVDDNETNLEILRYMLTSQNLNVTACVSGKEALAEIKKAHVAGEPFDVCVVDIKMPEMDGYEVARQIRSNPAEFGGPPLLAFSSSTIFAAKKSAEAGFDGFLPKPVRRDRLFQMMAHLLGAGKEERAERQKEELVTQHSLGESIKRSVNILLVEDNPVNQKLAKIMLDRGGYKVEVAGNGKEAVERFTTDPGLFDLIFMDIQMPEMDGYETVTHMRADPRLAAVPIVGLSAYAMATDREKALQTGFTGYIEKPIELSAFVSELARYLPALEQT